MKIAIRYYSRGGNTKKVAEAIGEALNVEALDITHDVSDCDLLFFGSSMYAFTVDKNVKQYISKLSVDNVKSIVSFSTSASDTSTHKKIKKCLKDKEIKMLDEHLSLPGEFIGMNKGRPNQKDLETAKEFAKTLVDKLSIDKK